MRVLWKRTSQQKAVQIKPQNLLDVPIFLLMVNSLMQSIFVFIIIIYVNFMLKIYLQVFSNTVLFAALQPKYVNTHARTHIHTHTHTYAHTRARTHAQIYM